jgi:hypothetical protein
MAEDFVRESRGEAVARSVTEWEPVQPVNSTTLRHRRGYASEAY